MKLNVRGIFFMTLLDISVEHESYEIVLVCQSVNLMHCEPFFWELAYAIPRFLNSKVGNVTVFNG